MLHISIYMNIATPCRSKFDIFAAITYKRFVEMYMQAKSYNAHIIYIYKRLSYNELCGY